MTSTYVLEYLRWGFHVFRWYEGGIANSGPDPGSLFINNDYILPASSSMAIYQSFYKLMEESKIKSTMMEGCFNAAAVSTGGASAARDPNAPPP